MNKLVCFIWIGFLAGCASVNKEEAGYSSTQKDAQKESRIYESQFTAERLSEKHFEAFETRAIEKLHDFTDYLRIISDDRYNEEFKINAMTQARELFIEHSLITLPDITESASLDAFLDQSYQNPNPGYLIIENPSIKVPLREATKNLYEGAVAFQLSLLVNGDTLKTKTEERQAQFYLMKTEKNFGAKKKKVWEVFLGDIY